MNSPNASGRAFVAVMTLLIGLISLTLASCQTVTTAERAELARITITSDICSAGWMNNITYDGQSDTKPTKDQIKRFNAGRDAFCRN